MNQVSTRNGFVFGLLALAFVGGSAFASEVKIGIVDMQKALQTVDAGKKARAEMEKDFNAKKKTLQAEEEKLKKLDEEFKKQSLALSDDARQKKQAEFQQKVMQLQQMAAQSQGELQKREADLVGPLMEKMRGVIAEIAKSKGYTVILEKGQGNVVMYSNEQDDVTAAVVEAFNKKHKS